MDHMGVRISLCPYQLNEEYRMKAILDFVANNEKGYIHCTVEQAYSLYSRNTGVSIHFAPELPFTYEYLQERLEYELGCYTFYTKDVTGTRSESLKESHNNPSITSCLTLIGRYETDKPIFLILPTVELAEVEYTHLGTTINLLRLPQALPEGVFVVLGRDDGKTSYIYTEATPQLEYGTQLN